MTKQSGVVSHHAKLRAQERWGVEISVAEIERQIASGEAEVYERENARIWKLLIRTPEGWVPIVYNSGLKTVLTVLPREELANIREDYGCGFSSKEERTAFYLGLDGKRRRAVEAHKRQCELYDPRFNIGNVRRAQKIMDLVDSFPEPVRKVVHEHGHYVVEQFWAHSIRDANDMGTLIEASRRAASADSPGLMALFRHFRARSDASAHYLATVARNEPPPKAPTQLPVLGERSKNRRANALRGRAA